MLLQRHTPTYLHSVIVTACLGCPISAKFFWVKEMLKVYNKRGTRMDTRKPIILPILRRIKGVVQFFSSIDYMTSLFQTMFTTAFFAFLRIGEIRVSDRSSLCIQLSQMARLLTSGGSTVGFKMTFCDFKHSYNHQINLYRRLDTCPVQSLEEYITRPRVF